ncbi:MAG TPA: hypothetical protein VM187_18730, partial [Niastella sp.]|nr:hypothetical protein [Niastella sp.]
MELEITDSTLFKEIQDAFNNVYPFLWIDFFYHPASDHNHFEKIKPGMVVRNLCPFKGTKSVSISGNRSVAQLESDFWDVLCVKTKVLRRSGNVWVG